MQEPLKILVIRFSSIGDIILTTPIIRCLKQQLNADVDFLTKNEYMGLLNRKPWIRFYSLEPGVTDLYPIKPASNQ